MARLLSLVHATSLTNAERILKSGSIFSGADAILKGLNLSGFTSSETLASFDTFDGYPGAYCGVITSSMIGNTIQYDEMANVYLVICISLLNRKDWHFNRTDANGFFDSRNTIVSEERLMSELEETDGNFDPLNEIVFHHSIPINFIVEIRVPSREIKAKLVSKLTSMTKDARDRIKSIIKVCNEIPDHKYDCPGKIKDLTPNYCFIFDPYKRDPWKKEGYDDKMCYYKWMAKQCGLTDNEISHAGTPDEINKLLIPIVSSKFKAGI